MQQPSPADEYATAEELSDAVGRLTVEERIRLAKKARILIWGTEYSDPLELLSEAVKRALIAATGDRSYKERGRPWPKNRVDLPAFLSECMKSIADSSRESIHQTMTVELEAIAGDNCVEESRSGTSMAIASSRRLDLLAPVGGPARH